MGEDDRVVRVLTRKWPDDPHWEFDARSLGADAHGHWVGLPRGTLMTRPGMRITAAADHVCLVPYDDWWVATFYGVTEHERDAGRPFDVYVDVATRAIWDGDEVRAVDLDLDVVRSTGGRIFIDDEDEFAEHQVSRGYPAEVVAAAEGSARRLVALLEEGTPPFDSGTSAGWLARLRSRIG